MKLRNIKIDESIKSQFKKALEDEHTVLDPTTADALKNEEDVRKELDKEFKENDKVAEEVAKATAGDQAVKVKDRKELTKLLSENQNKKAKISRCLEEGYRYLVEWIEEIEMERDGEEDNTYLVIEGAREGYGIDQVEGDTITVKELKEILDNYDDDIKVVIGNDFRSGSYYTYGAVNEGNMKEVRITEPEEEEEEEEEEVEESLKEGKEEGKEVLNEKNNYWVEKDNKEQEIQQIVCELYSKFSNELRDNIYRLVANMKDDFPTLDYDDLIEKGEFAIVEDRMADYLDTGNSKYLDPEYKEESTEESLKEDKEQPEYKNPKVYLAHYEDENAPKITARCDTEAEAREYFNNKKYIDNYGQLKSVEIIQESLKEEKETLTEKSNYEKIMDLFDEVKPTESTEESLSEDDGKLTNDIYTDDDFNKDDLEGLEGIQDLINKRKDKDE